MYCFENILLDIIHTFHHAYTLYQSFGLGNKLVLQTHDSKFEPWRSETEHATSRSRRLPTILTFTRGWGRNIFCFFETAETGNRTPNSGVKGSGANHYPRAPAHCTYNRADLAYAKCPAEWKSGIILRTEYI